MSKTNLSVAFDTVVEALSDAGVTVEDLDEHLLMNINGMVYKISIEPAD